MFLQIRLPRSRIVDADMAAESAELAKSQVLQQSAMAMIGASFKGTTKHFNIITRYVRNKREFINGSNARNII